MPALESGTGELGELGTLRAEKTLSSYLGIVCGWRRLHGSFQKYCRYCEDMLVSLVLNTQNRNSTFFCHPQLVKVSNREMNPHQQWNKVFSPEY